MKLTYPIDTIQEIKNKGIIIEFSELDSNIAFMFKNGALILPQKNNLNYIRFCCAYYHFWHELKPDRDTVYRTDFNYPNIFPVESLILSRTMDYLVPEMALSIFINKRKIQKVDKLKEIFGVSLTLITSQLKRFDFI